MAAYLHILAYLAQQLKCKQPDFNRSIFRGFKNNHREKIPRGGGEGLRVAHSL